MGRITRCRPAHEGERSRQRARTITIELQTDSRGVAMDPPTTFSATTAASSRPGRPPRRHANAPGLASALAIALFSIGSAHPLVGQLAVRETSLGARPEGTVRHTIEVSAAMRLGCVVATAAGNAVVIDGVRGPLHADVDTARQIDTGTRPFIGFSPDGKRFACRVRQGEGGSATGDSIPEDRFIASAMASSRSVGIRSSSARGLDGKVACR